MRDLLLLQLGFNILILSALLVLSRTGRMRRRGARPSERKARLSRKSETAASKPKKAAPAPPEAPERGALDELIRREEAKELVAEEALRVRLDRFRARAAG